MINQYSIVYAQDSRPPFSFKEPIIGNPKLKAERVSDEFTFATGMAFLGPDGCLYFVSYDKAKIYE
jgi:hypothetical protein